MKPLKWTQIWYILVIIIMSISLIVAMQPSSLIDIIKLILSLIIGWVILMILENFLGNE